jgi:hypothetical protein
MKTLKIMNLSYGKNQCRYTLIKEREKYTSKRAIYIVAELPFNEDDSELDIRANLLASTKHKSYLDALEDYSARLSEEWKLGSK